MKEISSLIKLWSMVSERRSCKKVLKFFPIWFVYMTCVYNSFNSVRRPVLFFEVRFTNVWSVSVLSVLFYMKKGFCLSVLVLMSVSCVWRYCFQLLNFMKTFSGIFSCCKKYTGKGACEKKLIYLRCVWSEKICCS